MHSHGRHDCLHRLLELPLMLVSAAGAVALLFVPLHLLSFLLLAAPGVVSLCAVGVSSVSAIVILSSPLSSSSLLLLAALGPLFE